MYDDRDLLRFGVFELDLRAGELRRGGGCVRLSPQPFKLLALLAGRAGELVTRDQIRQHLWDEGTFVDFDGSLSFCVNQIRSALGDSASAPHYVLTVPRRGYRFIAPVNTARAGVADARARAVGPPAVAPPPARRTPVAVAAVLLVVSVAAAALITRRPPGGNGAAVRLAVLPIADLSPAPEPNLADGLTDTLITQIARVNPKRLGVTGRTSVMAWAGSRRDVPSLGRALDVDFVLEGSVLTGEGRTRVSVRLVRPSDEQDLWTDAYERPTTDRLVLQQEVAARVAHALDVRLLHIDSSGARSSPARQAAHDAYLRAQQLFERGDSWGTSEALTLYERAAAADPGFAMALVGKARAYAMLAASGAMRGVDALEPARVAASRAIDLDPSIAEAHATLGGVLLYLDWDWEGARREFETALLLNPNLAIAHLGHAAYASARGNHLEALEEAREALELDPFDPAVAAEAAWYYYFARRYDEAIDVSRHLIDLAGPSLYNLACLELAHLARGDATEAIASRRRLLEAFGTPEVVLADFTSRLEKEGLRGYHQWRVERALAAEQRGMFVPLVAAAPFVQLGRTDEALARIDAALAIRDSAAIFLGVWPEFDGLRSDSRFLERLRTIGLH